MRATVLLASLKAPILWITDHVGKQILKYFLPPDKIITEYSPDINAKIQQADTYCLDNHNHYFNLFRKYNGITQGYFQDGNQKMIPANSDIASLQPYETTLTTKSYQQALIEGTGFKWKKQDYSFPLNSCDLKYDIGINHHVHKGWISKRWPQKHWDSLFENLCKRYSTSWQQGLNNLDDYIQWVHSCRCIITQDSFGLHLASALRKKTIAITGPTDNREFSYGRITNITPPYRTCMPCNKPKCSQDTPCLYQIHPKTVLTETNKLMAESIKPDRRNDN